MDGSIEIQVSDVFDESEVDTAIARLLIVSRQAAVLRDLLGETQAGVPEQTERRLVLFTYYTAAIKELVDAFHYLDSLGVVRALCAEGHALSDLREAATHAALHLDKKNPKSLYAKFLKRVRDSAGFHVALPQVRIALTHLAQERFPASHVTGPKQRVTSVPLAAAALACIAAEDPSDIRKAAAAARKLHDAIEAVAHALYFINVRIATES